MEALPFATSGVTIEVPDSDDLLEKVLDSLPDTPAVYAVHARSGSPLIARTAALRRRLRRLLRRRDKITSGLSLRLQAVAIDYWPAPSRLASLLIFYAAARRWYPDDYRRRSKLRLPYYVQLSLGEAFPRLAPATHLSRNHTAFGPFASRAHAEDFEREAQGLFQLRRCSDTLDPTPEHPGCIYGEMNLCLRPCQQSVTREEYASEALRAADFLATSGRSQLTAALAARDRLSAELEFEAAAAQHSRAEKIREMMRAKGELASMASSLSGVAVVPAAAEDAVELRFLINGAWMAPVEFARTAPAAAAMSLDERLKQTVSVLRTAVPSRRHREEHLALLARWFYSSWRDGEWIGFESLETIPYRRLVRAVSKVLANS